jgi:hypothetical protein
MQSFVWLVSVLVLLVLSTVVLWRSTLAQTPGELAGAWRVSRIAVTPGQHVGADQVEGTSAMITVHHVPPSWPLQLTNDRNQSTWGKLTGRRIVTTQAGDLPGTPHWPVPGRAGLLSKDPVTGQYVITWEPNTAGLQSIWTKQGPLAARPQGAAGP